MSKLKLGIFDFTDCEGCQVEILALKEKLAVLPGKLEIVNWRLGQKKARWERFDAALIEGTALTAEEIVLLKSIREKSKLVIALGTCATLGGIPAILNKEERQKWSEKIYSPEYQGQGIDALPLSAYIAVDFYLHGCPVNKENIEMVLSDLINRKKLKYQDAPVCLQCRAVDLPCRLLEKKPCLGPITQGGCGAICLQGGNACYGCFGPRAGANMKALLKILSEISSPEETKSYLTMFLSKFYKSY